VLRVFAQLVAVGAVALILYVLWFNLTNNLRAQGIRTDFGFLGQPVGVNIADSTITPGSSVLRALQVGIKNTLALAIVGIPLLTVIGVLVGIGRLSTNWLVAKTSTLYVEVFRNLPPLLIIVFAFRAVVLRLPPAREPATPFDLFVISNLRITVPGFEAGAGAETFWLVVLAGLALALGVATWRTRRSDVTGQPHHRVAWAGGALATVAITAFVLLDRPIGLTIPTLDGRVVEGGFSGLGAFFAVMGALVVYTASHVAEIVRGSIQAVPKGQTEAANALALSSFQRLRFVVLPQAFRIAIPPVINQYLNYVKNTSLAIAIGYAEVTAIAIQAIGNGQPAPQLILMVMAGYLLFSLSISLVVNMLNRRLQFVTR
jgi:general L-amino acid transport system permease protein